MIWPSFVWDSPGLTFGEPRCFILLDRRRVVRPHTTHMPTSERPPLVRGRTFKEPTLLICFVAQLTVYDRTSGIKLMCSIFLINSGQIMSFMFIDWCKTEGALDNSHPPHGLVMFSKGRFCEHNQESK